ncbi:MAG: replicative helicase loader/inhibitor, partial [Pseudoramibacter sp.]
MTKQGAARIMKMLKAAYPNFDNNANPADVMDMWLWRFKTTPFEVVFEAVGEYIDGDHEFAPTVGQIKQIIRDKNPGMTAAEGWQEIERALKNAGRDSKAEFDKLSPAVRAYVKSPATLKYLATTPYSAGEYEAYQERFFKYFKGDATDQTPDTGDQNKKLENGGADPRMQKMIAHLDQKMREKNQEDQEEEEKKKDKQDKKEKAKQKA